MRSKERFETVPYSDRDRDILSRHAHATPRHGPHPHPDNSVTDQTLLTTLGWVTIITANYAWGGPA